MHYMTKNNKNWLTDNDKKKSDALHLVTCVSFGLINVECKNWNYS